MHPEMSLSPPPTSDKTLYVNSLDDLYMLEFPGCNGRLWNIRCCGSLFSGWSVIRRPAGPSPPLCKLASQGAVDPLHQGKCAPVSYLIYLS